jgi:arylformamidase
MKDAVFLSHPLSNETPLYGGAEDIGIKSASSIKSGDTANTLLLSFPNHASTHLDTPYHFFNYGKKLTDYDASSWIYNNPVCIDVPCDDGYLVTYDDVNDKMNIDIDLLLIRTGYEKYRNEQKYWQQNPGLSANLAQELRNKYPNIRAVGIDVISITSRMHREEGRKVHREFLGSHFTSKPIVLIEDMSLFNYTDNISKVIVLPLMIKDGDGAPCSVIAF